MRAAQTNRQPYHFSHISIDSIEARLVRLTYSSSAGECSPGQLTAQHLLYHFSLTSIDSVNAIGSFVRGAGESSPEQGAALLTLVYSTEAQSVYMVGSFGVQVSAAQAKGQRYTVVFVGGNGVG